MNTTYQYIPETTETMQRKLADRDALHYFIFLTTEAEADLLAQLVDECNSNPAMIAYAMEREMQADERAEAEAGEVAQWLNPLSAEPEGSDNTMLGQLRDAGLGLDGRL